LSAANLDPETDECFEIHTFAVMKRLFSYLFFLAVSLSVISGTTLFAQPFNSKDVPDAATVDYIESYYKSFYSQIFNISEKSINDIGLYNAIEPWLGTPYKFGGKSEKGIDCSGFVNQIYTASFCTALAGSSYHIYDKVTLINKEDLKEGDLVFFRINPRFTVSHVGIYIGENKFVHASVKQGVIISDLDEPYYKKHFKKGGKVELPSN